MTRGWLGRSLAILYFKKFLGYVCAEVGKGSTEESRAGPGWDPPSLPSASRMLHAAEAAFSTQHDPQQGRDSTTLQDVTAATKPLDMMHSRL